MSHDPMVFDSLEPVTIPVKIENQPYILREADLATCVNYRNTAGRAARFNAEGNLSGIDGAANVEPVLLSQCLYRADADDVNDFSTYRLRMTDNKPDPSMRVAEATIRSWRGSISAKLFDKAREISDLYEKETEEALQKQIDRLQRRLDKVRGDMVKNSPGDSTESSITV